MIHAATCNYNAWTARHAYFLVSGGSPLLYWRKAMQTRRPSPGLHYAWIILAICFVNLFISYSICLGYGIVLPEMIRTVGLTRTQGADIFWTPFYGLGAIVSNRVTGHIRDVTGAFTIPFLLAVLTALAAAFLMLFVKAPSERSM